MELVKKVLIAVSTDLYTDQRVIKTANHITSLGFEVIVFSIDLPNNKRVKCNFRVVRKRLFFKKGFLFYAEFNIRLFFYITFNKVKYLYLNDLDILLAGYLAGRLKKNKIIYDSHEYFTETPELQNRNLVKKIWLTIEKIILPKIENSVTVNERIAKIYKNKYGVKMEVVRNLPSKKQYRIVKKVFFPTNNKVVLYQGVLNPGRGIELMIKALHFIDNVDLVIIGYGKVEKHLKSFTMKESLDERVHFLGKISPELLHNYTKIADVGMVLEEPLGKSFKYSLPNKLFDFIHCEVPIIASPLKEIKSVVETHKVGLVIEEYNPAEIAKKISKLLYNTDLRNEIKLNQQKIKDLYFWENDVIKINKFFKN